jgi:hypothetical protein
MSSELVKIALPFYTAVGFDEPREVPNAKMASLWIMALWAVAENGRFQKRSLSTRFTVVQNEPTLA